jgi:hypothetical protein
MVSVPGPTGLPRARSASGTATCGVCCVEPCATRSSQRIRATVCDCHGLGEQRPRCSSRPPRRFGPSSMRRTVSSGMFVMLCAFAGLRLGEAAGLQVGDIDVAARTITVRRQVQRASGPAVVISPPKHGSERTVYLADGVLDPYERICFGYLTGTSQGGCSLASPVRTRYIRTASATCGARRGQPPDCPRSGCTTFGTSTPRD